MCVCAYVYIKIYTYVCIDVYYIYISECLLSSYNSVSFIQQYSVCVHYVSGAVLGTWWHQLIKQRILLSGSMHSSGGDTDKNSTCSRLVKYIRRWYVLQKKTSSMIRETGGEGNIQGGWSVVVAALNWVVWMGHIEKMTLTETWRRWGCELCPLLKEEPFHQQEQQGKVLR